MILNGGVKMTYTTQNTGKTCDQGEFFKSIQNRQWPSSILSIFQNIHLASNQVLLKNKAMDSIDGVRYIFSTEPSTLRPVRSWIIRIEEWVCGAQGVINAQDALFIRISNIPDNGQKLKIHQSICDIRIRDVPVDVNEQSSFNAIMATSIFISKIDAGRLPDVGEILSLYQLQE
jgi:hypothetical protein